MGIACHADDPGLIPLGVACHTVLFTLLYFIKKIYKKKSHGWTQSILKTCPAAKHVATVLNLIMTFKKESCC